jgi:malate dehydrogenase (oxaloacetate-decarboxylating)(NADP+)
MTKRKSTTPTFNRNHGRLQVAAAVPCATQADLAKVYTPGVGAPARLIAKQPSAVYQHTAKGNLVAVVTNGTAVLGLGDVGPLAAKPVMEGKAVLFKRFAGIDAFDLEVASKDPAEFIQAVSLLAPTFGGINLEDIAAPDCFYIEQELQRRVDIPVFHDDQHGTAIISGAALLNALELVGKKIADAKIVFSGAGAAGIRCAEHYLRLGAQKRNVYMCDSHGLVTQERRPLDASKRPFAKALPAASLADTLHGADVFIGVSVANIVTPAMIKTMTARPIVFALANPDPEIAYGLAKRARHDILLATGRSDYPNQINNVLGFPFVFRGALDVRARAITPNMLMAATRALADLAHQPVPHVVLQAYRLKQLQFGPDYIVPKPFDPRLVVQVSASVAAAAMADGVAGQRVTLVNYRKHLQRSYGHHL